MFGCVLPFFVVVLLIVVGTTRAVRTANSPAVKAQTAATMASLPRYAGKWQGADGTALWIRGDGHADFNSGNTKVTGGGVTIDENGKKLTISSFFGIGKTWRLDRPPQNPDDKQMTLDGIRYQRRNY